MALKDTWVDLQDVVEGVPDSGSDISVEPINEIAHAVIQNENNMDGFGVRISIAETDISNVLDFQLPALDQRVEALENNFAGIDSGLDNIIAIQNELIGGGTQ